MKTKQKRGKRRDGDDERRNGMVLLLFLFSCTSSVRSCLKTEEKERRTILSKTSERGLVSLSLSLLLRALSHCSRHMYAFT